MEHLKNQESVNSSDWLPEPQQDDARTTPSNSSLSGEPSLTGSNAAAPSLDSDDDDLLQLDDDFIIYKDETSTAPQRRRSFYGSNVPVLVDITNGHSAHYAPHHRTDELMSLSLHEGDLAKYMFVKELKESDEMTLAEVVTGWYKWSFGEHPLDVYLWLQAHKYDSKWSNKQKKGFRELLKNMYKRVNDYVRNGEGIPHPADDEVMKMFRTRIQELGIETITLRRLKGPSLHYAFNPAGEDMIKWHREDFTPAEQRLIEAERPECFLD